MNAADRCLRRGELRLGLGARLTPYIDLVVDAVRTDREISWPMTRDAGSAEASDPRKPRAWAFQAFREGLIGDMAARTLRAEHNTRKTDAQVQVLGRDGPHLAIRHCLGWNEPTGEDDCRSTSEERITNPNRSRR